MNEASPEVFAALVTRLPQEIPSPPDGADRPCVLLAEDDKDLLVVMTTVLEANGFAVHACADGRDIGLAYSVQKRVDIVLSDVQMRFFSGIEVARAIASLDPLVPIILLSGEGLSLEDERTIASRGWHLLLKPFGAEQLVFTIKSHLRRPEAKAAAA